HAALVLRPERGSPAGERGAAPRTGRRPYRRRGLHRAAPARPRLLPERREAMEVDDRAAERPDRRLPDDRLPHLCRSSTRPARGGGWRRLAHAVAERTCPHASALQRVCSITRRTRFDAEPGMPKAGVGGALFVLHLVSTPRTLTFSRAPRPQIGT